MNEEHWRRYAQLLVRCGVGLRPGQPLYVYGEVAHRHLMALLTEAAYEAGGGRVETRLLDPLLQAALVRHGRLEDIELCHAADQAWLHDLLRHGGAYICLNGAEDPDLWHDLARSHPDRHGAYLRGLSAATGGFYSYGVERRWCPWLTAACPTPGWAREVFPELPEHRAHERLTELIFCFTGADRENAFERAAAKDRLLKARCRWLDQLAITKIHVIGGGSDFRVGLSSKARWQGGSETTIDGQTFYYNLPAEEVFTTPDKRLTEGRLAATRPFRFPGGPLVRDLVLHFRNGRVVDLDARSGGQAFARWLDADDGARYLGEFALASEDSALARSGIFWGATRNRLVSARRVGLTLTDLSPRPRRRLFHAPEICPRAATGDFEDVAPRKSIAIVKSWRLTLAESGGIGEIEQRMIVRWSEEPHRGRGRSSVAANQRNRLGSRRQQAANRRNRLSPERQQTNNWRNQGVVERQHAGDRRNRRAAGRQTAKICRRATSPAR